MAGVLADTHAAVWYLARSALLSAAARQVMADTVAAGAPVYVASISLVEIRYLIDRDRLPEAAFTTLDRALADSSIGLRLVALDQAVARAVGQVPRDQVPDMPDRIIAASALVLGVPLVTRDSRLRGSSIHTIW
jgi:PIN domain nuclease of toxin-antitoxin system